MVEGQDLNKQLWLTVVDDTGELVHVYTVDGEYVSRYLDVGMAEGGNEYADEHTVPKGEVWLFQNLSDDTKRHVLVHEMTERRLMRDGESYDTAHPKANEAEAAYLREKYGCPAPHISD